MSQEVQGFNYAFVSTNLRGDGVPEGRWSHGRSLDGNGEFHVVKAEPMGGLPQLAPPDPRGHAQTEQMLMDGALLANLRDSLS